MADNYLKLTTERINDSLNFRHNHRFYLLYGKNSADEFLTRSYYRASLLQTLWATLKTNSFERVVFYNFADKFFFLDENSARLMDGAEGGPQSSTQTASSGRRQVGPMGAARNVLSQKILSASNPAENAPPDMNGRQAAQFTEDKNGIIRMAPGLTTGSGMAHASVLTHFNDFITNNKIRTALVIEDLENLSRIDASVKSQLATRLQQWRALPNRNRNAVIFINSRNPGDEDSRQAMRDMSNEFADIANLVSVAFGQKNDEAEGSILYIPTPSEAEVERWLTTFRLKNKLPVEWLEFKKLAQWMTAENKQLKDLDGKLHEYAAKRAAAENPVSEKLSLAIARKNNWISGDSDPRPAQQRLEEMIGLNGVKKQIKALELSLKADIKRRRDNPELNSDPPNLHLIFTGSPGTGKTTVARLIGEIYRDLGLLKRGHTVSVLKGDIVAGFVNQTAPRTNTKINEALDGVFFLDEAYTLKEPEDRGEDFGRAALTTIMARMENERHRLAVILAGYEDEMKELVAMNSGMPRRIGRTIQFEDYNGDELLQIFEQLVAKGGFVIDQAMRETMLRLFTRMYEQRNNRDFFSFDDKGKSTFGNAGQVGKFFQEMKASHAVRLSGDTSAELTPDDIPDDYEKFLPAVTAQNEVTELLAELNNMVGLEPVKEVVRELIEEAHFARLGMDGGSSPLTRHMVFTGNPGTGKTTVARLLGRIYKTLGILQRGHFREVKRPDLVAEYTGHTEPKTLKAVNDALDGVLFIDEAYSLVRDPMDSFGRVAIDVLVPLLEDHRDRLVVVFAGYTNEMQYFLNSNPGLDSRIAYKIEFPDYEPDMLLEIFLRMAEKDDFIVPDEVRFYLQEMLTRYHAKRGKNFGNARDVRVQFYDKMRKQFRRRYLEESESTRHIFPKSFIVSDLIEIKI